MTPGIPCVDFEDVCTALQGEAEVWCEPFQYMGLGWQRAKAKIWSFPLEYLGSRWSKGETQVGSEAIIYFRNRKVTDTGCSWPTRAAVMVGQKQIWRVPYVVKFSTCISLAG
jgi:hypothetical protein